jgi:dipeptidyl aminopeptidase/acylaminoacyl peptidase
MRRSWVLLFCIVLAGCAGAQSGAAPTDGPERSPGPAPALAAAIESPSSALAAAPSSSSASSIPVGRIAFQRTGDRAGIYLIDADGSHEQLVLAGAYGAPKWSPDGSRLAIYAEKPDGRVVPALIGSDGSGYRELTLPSGLNCGLAAWSPGGMSLALECWDEQQPRRTGIYLADVDGATAMRRLTTTHGMPGAFSAGGDSVLFARDAGNDATELAIVGTDGTGERTLDTRTIGQTPGFMPGDQGIYVVVDGMIDVLDTSGRQLRTIRAPEPKILEARLSPDGRWFAIVYDPLDAVAPGLYRMGVDGTGVATIAHTDVAGIEEAQPDWAP